MEKALHRKKLYTGAIYGVFYIQQGPTHKAEFYIKRSYTLRTVTHGVSFWMEKKYIRRQITPKRGSYAKRVHMERDYVAELRTEKVHIWNLETVKSDDQECRIPLHKLVKSAVFTDR